MGLIRCEANEHYFDDAKYSTCPYCKSETVHIEETQIRREDDRTVMIKTGSSSSNSEKTQMIKENIVPKSAEIKKSYASSDEPKTKGIWNKPKQQDESLEKIEQKKMDIPKSTFDGTPAVAWLVVTEGKGEGCDLRLIPGMNTIGRNSTNTIRVDFGDNSISREKHAIVVYDYRNNLFFLQHGDGQNLTYLNGSVVLQTQQLKAYDEIQMGDTKFLFIPFCTDSFKWQL